MDINQFTKDGRFLMLALDQRGSFKKILNPHVPEQVTDEEMIATKKEIIEALYADMSAILIDPKYGLPAYMSLNDNKKPFLLCIEQSGYKDEEGERITTLEYTVGQLKAMGAMGIKLNLNFNPLLPHSGELIQLVKGVSDDCRKFNLPFFLEIVTYGQRSKFEQVIEAVKTFLKEQIVPSVFKLEYPGDSESCKNVTQLLGKTPWILLTLGIPYEIFKINLTKAILQGASGFLAGRSIWQEFGQYQADERKFFLQNTAAKRFHEISSIVLKNSFLV